MPLIIPRLALHMEESDIGLGYYCGHKPGHLSASSVALQMKSKGGYRETAFQALGSTET